MIRSTRTVVTNPIIPWILVVFLTFYIAFSYVGWPIQPETCRRYLPCTKCKCDFKKPNSFNRDIPLEQKLDHTGDITRTFQAFESHVTILVYGVTRSDKCLREQLENITSVFPKVRILVSVKSDNSYVQYNMYKNVNFLTDVSSEGDALNKMISMVKTDYFLYLSRGDTIDTYDSDNSVGWLYRALEKVPQMDVIGASFLAYNSSLKYPQLDIPCHRTKMCHWVFSQTYEYQYSVGDVMICEETSSSFMARTRSISASTFDPTLDTITNNSSTARTRSLSTLTFDPTLDTMVTSDFFWRYKAKIIMGLMPEAFLHVTEPCQDPAPSAVQESLNKQSFMDKYSLTRVVNSFGKVTDYPKNPKRKKTKSVLPTMRYKKHGGVNTPQARETLRFYVGFMDDAFTKHNIPYVVVNGVALGGIKMRDVLPWDTGDVDMEHHTTPCSEVLKAIEEEMVKTGVRFKIDIRRRRDARCVNIKLLPVYYGVDTDVYTRDPFHVDDHMYIFINDRYIPVRRNLFSAFREDKYGDYLQNIDNRAKKHHQCTIPGHHACVPDEFAQGGGNWRDFYC